jgi:hypothetical protein
MHDLPRLIDETWDVDYGVWPRKFRASSVLPLPTYARSPDRRTAAAFDRPWFREISKPVVVALLRVAVVVIGMIIGLSLKPLNSSRTTRAPT